MHSSFASTLPSIPVRILVSFLRPSPSVVYLSVILSSVRAWSPTAVLTFGLAAFQVGLVPEKPGEVALMSLGSLGRGQPLHPSSVPRTPQPPGFPSSCLLLISLFCRCFLFQVIITVEILTISCR